MEKSKFRKYLLYAIGEIILVVIGILIALQINNWNENRKNRTFELKMLSEIKEALEGDLIFLKQNTVERTKILDSTLNLATQYVKAKIPFTDSLYNNGFAYNLEIGVAINFNRGPYDALKTAGIDKITNDTLRNKLLKYYDFELPFWIILLEEFTEEFQNHVNLLNSLRLEGEVLNDNRGDYMARLYPKDLFLNAEFKRFLWLSKRRSRNTLQRVDRFIPILEDVLENVNKELEL